MNLGYIDYLNCYPFYYHMFEKEQVKNVRVFPGYPGMLNRMTAAGELDMSPISSAACAEIADRVRVLSGFCLSSVGYVGSVILASKLPIHELDGKKIGLTSASHTSVVLLKILLKKYFNAEPEYLPSGPMPSFEGLDAALMIGNEAMMFKNDSGLRLYDLGKLWMEKTGFPVVFAVFAIRENALAEYRFEIGEVVSSYKKSLRCLSESREDLIAKAGERYPDISHDIGGYYDLLRFEFSEDLKNALKFYYKTAEELNLLKIPVQPNFFDLCNL